jgi:hypothetical protein
MVPFKVRAREGERGYWWLREFPAVATVFTKSGVDVHEHGPVREDYDHKRMFIIIECR